MSTGDDQPFGGAAPPPRSIFDDPTVQVSLSHEPEAPGADPNRPPDTGVFGRDPYATGARPRSGAQRPNRGRILSEDAPAGSLLDPPDPYQPAAWAGDRSAPPFGAPGAGYAADSGSVMERVVEGAYRWRSLLGLGLAGLMTVAIVVAYRGANDDREDVAVSQFSTPTGQAFGGDTATSEPGDTVVTSSLVSSQVDEVATTQVPSGPSQTRAPGTTFRSTTTATTRPPATSSTIAGTSSAPTSGTATSTSSTTDSSSTSGSAPTTSGSSSTTVPATTAPGSSTTQAGSTTSSTTGGSTSSTVRPKVHLEAEEGILLGQARVLSGHAGYSGTGFVGDLIVQGRGVTITVDNVAGGATPFRVRYAAGNEAITGTNRQLTVRVNGTTVAQLVMRETASWTDWTDLTGTLPLDPGTNTITLVMGLEDSGFVNIDFVELN